MNPYGYPNPYPTSDYYRDSRRFPEPPPGYQNGGQMYQNPSSAGYPSGEQTQWNTTQPAVTNQVPTNDFIRVSGPKAVYDFVLQPNQRVQLFEVNRPIMYIKETDKLGTASIGAYNITEINFEELLNAELNGSNVNLSVSRNEIDDLRKQMDALTERMNQYDSKGNQSKQQYHNKNKEETK